LGDPVGRDVRPQRGVRVPPGHVIRRRADDFRNEIRRCSEWTSETLDLPGLVVGIPGELVSGFGVLERPFRVPVARIVIAFLIVLRGGAMGMRRQLMLFSGLAMCFVHGFLDVFYLDSVRSILNGVA
jgi:hypothetical protein